METLPKISLTRLFEDMDDPRVVGRCSYPLVVLPAEAFETRFREWVQAAFHVRKGSAQDGRTIASIA